jgi:Cd2+/Zn2+-exporting ATPase
MRGATSAAPAGGMRTAIRIEQMDCPTEEGLIRARLGRIDGVGAMEFNLMQRVVTVSHEPDLLDTVLAAIRALGFTPVIQGMQAPEAARRPWWPLALGLVAAAGAEVLEWLGAGPQWLPAVAALLAIALTGMTVFRKGWIAVWNRQLNINALMSIAVTGALILGDWPEAAMVMVLFAIAERIEAASLDRARHAIRRLMALSPDHATVQQAGGDWKSVPARDVVPGDHVRLAPGEKLAVDGVVVSGVSAIDQAAITGESVPVDKQAGDLVFAGTVNQQSELVYRATAPASGSTLARIVHAVEAAQSSRAPTQRFIDRFARIYTPAVIVVALLVAVMPPLLFGFVWAEWAYRALVLLVIACPCALVISTPVTIVSGLTAGARQGILIKGGAYLEQGHELAVMALDKTGTITRGHAVLTDFETLAAGEGVAQAVASPRMLACSLAARSDHPVSRAVLGDPAGRPALQPVEGFAALPGRGVRGRIGGREYVLGNHRLIHELGLCSDALEARLQALERQGRTTVLLADDSQVLAVAAVADTVRETSRQAVRDLGALGVRTVMLTGDNTQTARAIAGQVGIDVVHGELLPEDKADVVGSLADQLGTRKSGRRPSGRVGMVGDGINDAPALARADIGFAMGAAGSDIAIETADVALMDDDLRKVGSFVALSRRTSRVLRQNIVLALGIKAVFLTLTVLGMGTMWMAVFADMGASLLVVANGLRLLQRAPAMPPTHRMAAHRRATA